jgi:hypothetical protein
MVIANGTTEIRGLAGTWVHTAEIVTMPGGRRRNAKKRWEKFNKDKRKLKNQYRDIEM